MKTGSVIDLRYVFPLIQHIQVNTIDSACTIFINLSDGAFYTCFLKSFSCCICIKQIFAKQIQKIQL